MVRYWLSMVSRENPYQLSMVKYWLTMVTTTTNPTRRFLPQGTGIISYGPRKRGDVRGRGRASYVRVCAGCPAPWSCREGPLTRASGRAMISACILLGTAQGSLWTWALRGRRIAQEESGRDYRRAAAREPREHAWGIGAGFELPPEKVPN